jgi:hypothetical protein
MTDNNQNEYAVGYGKPPKRTQFKPGQSGNRDGRPRKTVTFVDEVQAEMNSKMDATENGKRIKLTKLRAMIKQLIINAINGNLGSAKLLFNCLQQNQPGEQGNLVAMLNAFEERNRQLAYPPAEGELSTDLRKNQPPTPRDENHND